MKYFKTTNHKNVKVFAPNKTGLKLITFLIPKELYTKSEFEKKFKIYDYLIVENCKISLEEFKNKYFEEEEISRSESGFIFGARFEFKEV